MPTLMQLDTSMANLSEWRVVQHSTRPRLIIVSVLHYSILGSIMPALMQLDTSMANLSEWCVVQHSTRPRLIIVSVLHYSILGSIMPALMQLDASMANLSEWRVVQHSTQYNCFLCILQHPWFRHADPDAARRVHGQSVGVARGPTLYTI